MNDLSSILRRQRRARGLTLAALAEAAGCSKAYLSMIENRRCANPPGAGLLARLEESLGLDVGVLRRLAVQMRLRTLLSDSAGRPGVGPGVTNLGPVGGAMRMVPLINSVAAGQPLDFTDLDYPVDIADAYVPAAVEGDAHAFAARVIGESMLPRYRQGDIVVFSPARPATDGCDCLVRILPDHVTTFKRIFFEPQDQIRLQPLNPDFPATRVPLEQVSGLYPAIARIEPIAP
jgi:repressor LexA